MINATEQALCYVPYGDVRFAGAISQGEPGICVPLADANVAQMPETTKYHVLPGVSLKSLKAAAFKRRLEQALDDTAVPLCIELGGTLVSCDITHELILAALRTRPRLFLYLLLARLFGRPNVMARLAQAANLDVAMLPIRKEVLLFLQRQKSNGRRILLTSTANFRIACALAAHHGLFAEVIASQDNRRLTHHAIARTLCARFGPGQFDYAGHNISGLPVWRTARRAIMVAPDRRLLRHVAWQSQTALVLAPPRRRLDRYIEALRPARWSRNFLVFLPLVALTHLPDLDALVRSYLAFCAFCLIDSAGHLTNDLIDLVSDRQHPVKQWRPLASGRLLIPHGVLLAATLALLGLSVAAFISTTLTLWMLFYLALVLGHSLWFKRMLLLGTLIPAGLYLHRIVAGAIAIAVTPSVWLIAFSMPSFLGTVILDKKHEANASCTTPAGIVHPTSRFNTKTLQTILGVTAGCASALVLAYYANSPAASAVYRSPKLLWLVCPLPVYWIAKALRQEHHGRMEDPVPPATHSLVGWTILAASVALFFLARFLPIGCLPSFFR